MKKYIKDIINIGWFISLISIVVVIFNIDRLSYTWRIIVIFVLIVMVSFFRWNSLSKWIDSNKTKYSLFFSLTALLSVLVTITLFYDTNKYEEVKLDKNKEIGLLVQNNINLNQARLIVSETQPSKIWNQFSLTGYRDNFDFIVSKYSTECVKSYVESIYSMESANRMNDFLSNIEVAQVSAPNLENSLLAGTTWLDKRSELVKAAEDIGQRLFYINTECILFNSTK